MSKDTVKLLKEAWDIVAEVQKVVTLTKRGQNFVGLCPFHSEKTPSFYVSPLKKIFHCFGCGENGDVIAFMMKIENLSFKEVLIEKATEFQIPHEFSSSTAFNHDLDHLREFLNQLQLKYQEWFKVNGRVQDYCDHRHLKKSAISNFGLGFADKIQVQKNWLNTLDNKKSATQSGLFKEDGFPLLSDRLIFPIHNSRGIIVGFSGRILTDEKVAKYINSPESATFSKKKLLYGIHLAKKTAKQKDRLIIVEGHMDVIAMHENGFPESVAVMGTALTDFHAKECAKYAKNIILMFDSDEAGQKAMRASLQSLQQNELNIKIGSLDEKDPSDFFLHKNEENMESILDNAPHYMDYFIEKVKSSTNLNDAAKKSEGVVSLAQMLAPEKNQIIIDHYIKRMSELFEVSENIIMSYVKKNKTNDPVTSTTVSFKTSSKYKKSEDLVLYFLISNLEFRNKYASESLELIPLLNNPEVKILIEPTDLLDYELIEKINHSEIKSFLLSLVIKFTEINVNYKFNEMEEILRLLKQNKFNERIFEIKQLLGSNQGKIEQEKELLIELSELIKKIK